ncbi:MAG: hypothetical protein M3O20_11230 [Acidobacteriota bacterium]|nr:hypothetical protein [Acidobacteriota bacterium]
MDLGALMDNPRTISRVTLTGMEITIPPKGERAKFGEGQGSTPVTPDDDQHPKPSVLVAEVFVRDTTLVILPRDKSKLPLRFDIHDVKLQAAGKDVAMRYDAWLRNPKPPGEIHSKGSFGPWAAEEPGDTPLTGAYTFDDADLGIFQGISGILHSVGNFQGTLSAINAKGTATVPDFRLKRADNPMPLYAQFEVGVDGTNGNTTLKPVHATLGRTTFTTSGAVIKHTGDERKTIVLDAFMPNGRMEDVIRLAMKGPPMMAGEVFLKTKIMIPPLSGTVKARLQLNGDFRVAGGKFLKSTIQDKIDELSRKAQGQPANQAIDEVFSRLQGRFKMEDEQITLTDLSFLIPGAAVALDGTYQTDQDVLDFHGTLRLDAKISQP